GGVEAREVLGAGEPRVPGGALHQGADGGQGLFGAGRHRPAEEGDLAGRRGDEPEQHADGRGLPRAVGSEEPEDRPYGYFEVEAVDDVDLAEPFGELTGADGQAPRVLRLVDSRGGEVGPPLVNDWRLHA